LSDSAADVAEFVAGEIAYAFAVKEDDCGYNGEGTSGFGGIAGLATNCRPDEKHGALSSRAAAKIVPCLACSAHWRRSRLSCWLTSSSASRTLAPPKG
jgi:hypothetical protein